MPLPVGTKLGPYEILAPIGRGGMGEVYRAQDLRLHRAVALKVLPGDKLADTPRKRRFLQEARAASALIHPNIVVLHDISHDAGMDFLIMEYVPGQTLRDRIKSGALAPLEVIRYGAQICSALTAAHAAGIVHRDIKPANIMVTPDGQIKVLDFGLAKLSEPGPGPVDETRTMVGETEPGVVMGTVAYMSPEQTRAELLDARTDIFSLGCVLYEAATGRLPFRGASMLAVMHEIATAEPVPPSQLRRDLPPEFDDAIKRALTKDKNGRYQSALEMAAALEALQPLPAKASFARDPSKRAKKWWMAGIAAVLLAVGAYYQWSRSRGHVPDPLAQQLYARGRQDIQEFTEHGFKQSIVDFNNAIKRDPEYVAAYAGLADAYSFQALFELAPPKEVMPLALRYAELALEKDPQQEEAYTSLAIVALGFDWDYPRAEQRFQKSLKINPRDAFTNHFLGHYYEFMGRWPDAVKQMRTALDLEKLSPMFGEDLGYDLFLTRRNDEALRQLRETVDGAKQDPYARNLLALALEANGQQAESLDQAREAIKLPGMFTCAGSLSGIFSRLHRPDLAREVLSQLEAAQQGGIYIAPLEFAMVQLSLGDNAKGLKLLRDAVEERDYNIAFVIVDPVFDVVREDPELAALMNVMHLPRACWHDVPRFLK